jgi:hypothetical protein
MKNIFICREQTDGGLKLFFSEGETFCEFAYTFKFSFDREVGGHLASEVFDTVMNTGGERTCVEALPAIRFERV